MEPASAKPPVHLEGRVAPLRLRLIATVAGGAAQGRRWMRRPPRFHRRAKENFTLDGAPSNGFLCDLQVSERCHPS